MFKSKSGFTIVELLIVIVVIGVLAAITIVAYTGIQNKAYNAQLSSAVDAYVKALSQYNVINGHYPQFADYMTTNACLGGPFPASPPLAANSCFTVGSTTFSQIPEVTAAIATVMTTVPTTQNEIKIDASTAIRGIMYSVQGSAEAEGAVLQYYVQGNQTCPRGIETHSSGGPDLTLCQILLQ